MRDFYKVVSASAEHVQKLGGIERSAASLFEGAVPSELLEAATPESDLLASQKDGTLWVALGPDDEPVGFARMVTSGMRAHLAEIDVTPPHGRRGVGTALVQTAEQWARENGIYEITLTTYRHFPWNCPFYAGLGFVVVPEADWDDDLSRRFQAEAGLDSEKPKRVAMRKVIGTA